MSDTVVLSKELETYEAHKGQLVSDSVGKFVVIKGDDVIDTWDTFEDAIKAGYGRFGMEPFLVKHIQGDQQVQFFSRDLRCPS